MQPSAAISVGMSANGLPATSPEDADTRTRLRFSVEGLSARDEILFKSLVRLLGHRTHQQWSYSTDKPHVRVTGDVGYVGEDLLLQRPASTAQAFQPLVLLVGHSRKQHEFFLHQPMHANELELLLNQIGSKVAGLVAVTDEPRLAATAPSAPVAVFSSARFDDNEGFVLHRWPPAAMLGSPVRIKLATVMRGRPMTLNALQKRSGFSQQECAEFVDLLRRAELLARTEPALQANAPLAAVESNPALPIAAPSPAPLPTASGRLAFVVSPKTASTSAGSQGPTIGLLARIRNRLGLSAPHSA
ncbi:MAG: hypothetical protein V4772_27220 [Pseudomonadota bacterium]